MLQLRSLPAALGVLLLTVVADPAFAQSCLGPQPAICPLGQPAGPDCRIDADCTVPSSPPYPVLDFGSRRLVVTKTITVGGDGILRVAAGAVALEGSGTIRALGAGQGTQRVDLTTTGDITIGSGAAIDVSAAGSGGGIELVGASVRSDGNLRANGTVREAYGGSITIDATGNLDLAGLDVRGGDQGFGGDASLYAGGTITVSAPLRAQGSDGGSVTLDAGGDVVTEAEIQVSATEADGYGGGVDAFAIGSVTIGGAVSGTGREGAHEGGSAGTGGDGAEFTIEALEGSVAINANVDLRGAPSGYGGDLEVTADLDVVVAGKISLGTEGILGSGSFATEITAGRNLTISKDIDASCPGYGGELAFYAGGTLAIFSRITVDGASDLDVGLAGTIIAQGDCALEIAPGAVLSALGAGDYPYAINDVRAANLTIGGTLQAGSENVLEYRTVNLLGTADLIPDAPLPGPSPTAPCCGDCPTTTTTAPPTTSTTLPPPTTSTTSSMPTSSSTSTSSPTSTTTGSSTSTTVTTTTTLGSTTSTSDVVEPTVTTTTELPSTTTTVATSTPTTVAPPPTTSTTVPPPGAECLEQPSGAAAAACRIGALSDTLGVSPPEALGGKATARRLTALLGRATRFLDLAGRGTNARGNLRKARRQLKSFDKQVQRGLKRRRGPIDAALGEVILGLAKDAMNDVGVIQASL